MLKNVTLALLGGLSCLACSDTEAPGHPIEADQILQDLANELTANRQLPGLILAEFSCEDRAFAWSGIQKIDRSDPIFPQSLFALGSNSKSFLALAAMRLSERGDIDLNEPLSALWPNIAADRPDLSDITLTHLLSHSSGLAAFNTGAELNRVPDFATRGTSIILQAAEWFLAQPMVGQPGQQTLYSNAGYVVAGAWLEAKTGQSYQELIDTYVAEPLGLSTSYGQPRFLAANGIYGHYISDDQAVAYTEDDPPIPAFLEPAGNIVLSMPDYVTYLQAHLCALQDLPSAVISLDGYKALHTPAINEGVGLGWSLVELGGADTSFHIGGTGDFTAYAALSAQRNKGVAALLNVGGAPAASVQAWVVEAMSVPEISVSETAED